MKKAGLLIGLLMMFMPDYADLRAQIIQSQLNQGNNSWAHGKRTQATIR